jgi:hypothetical protein
MEAKMRAALLAAIVVALVQASASAPLEPKKVHFAACTAAGVEHGCIVARGDDGELYNVGGALPGLKAGQWLQGTAVITDRVSYCMQGRTVANFSPDSAQQSVTCATSR